ncbi:MAG: GEVED domain-containing protein [Candidatus Aminicenantes bacterium]|jgi:hypothetical protein
MKEQSVSTKSGVGMRIGICISIAVLFLVFGGLSKGWTKAQSKSNVSLCHIQDGADITKAPKPVRILKKTGFGNVPLYFIPNKGQMNGKALFYAKTPGYTLWITQQGLVFDSTRVTGSKDYPAKEKPDRDVSHMVFKNASKSPEILSIEPTSYKVNYLKGSDQSHWHTGIPTSKAVLYKELYKNIDLKVYGLEKQIEYDWVIKPGANPDDIGFQYRGMKSCALDEAGNIAIETASGKWLHKKPLAYQVIDGRKVEVEAAFAIQNEDENQYGFRVGSYDKGHDLIIDPLVLVYSGFLGSSGDDYAAAMAIDAGGYIYVTGWVNGSDFPTMNAYQPGHGGDWDCFLTKLTPNGSALVFSTYLGGSFIDHANEMVLDSGGLIYIAGTTHSSDFPTFNPYQAALNGSSDAFTTILSADGSSLVYSTYLGGWSSEYCYALGVTSAGEVCLGGCTNSNDFPVYNAYDATFGHGTSGDYSDAFLTKFNASGNALVFSTYLGNSGNQYGSSLAIASNGDIYLAGATYSSDFPVSSQAYQTSFGGQSDGFISRFTSTGALDASTLYGGSSYDSIVDITLDSSDYLYIVRNYGSSMTTADSNAIVAKFNNIVAPSGHMAYSKYLCDSSGASAITVDSGGKAYITGRTLSPSFPVVNAFQDTIAGGEDAFVLVLSADGSTVDKASFLGGTDNDRGSDIFLDSSGSIYVCGDTWSPSFPVYQGFQMTHAGLSDGFVCKIEDVASPITLTSPNGGEDLEVGTYYDITWDNAGFIENVKLEYSTDSGATWELIEDPVANTGTYSWVVPDAPSDTCLVKVSDSAGPPTDSSDGFFTISPTSRSLTLTAPNGGESWDALTNHDINWTSTGGITDVKLMYSEDNGTTWNSLNSGMATPDDGSYTWSIPDTSSSQCLVRIEDADGITMDDSDAVFTIVAAPLSITVTSPNGGESWQAETTQMIQWDYTGAIPNVTLEYSTDNGSTWNTIASSIINNGSYNWNIPDTRGLNCLVKVSESGGSTTDTSDGVFTITSPYKYIKVYSPNGQETLYIGAVHTITWSCNFTTSGLKIEYTSNYGTTWNTIISSTPNDGSYDWTVPDDPTIYCKVRITDIEETATDISDQYCTITDPPKVITVISPNGGEDWETGTNQNITWTGTGGINDVKIEYSTDNGTVWNTIISSTPNDGSHSWTVPGVLSSNCLVKITDAAGPTSDTSDAVFTVSAVKTITVNAPNGGESWDSGTNQNITWSSTGSITSIRIEYSINNGGSWITIIGYTSNDGSHTWNVPDNPSGNCLVRVSDNYGPAEDTSDAVFTIVGTPKTISVISPNGSENWNALTNQNITWSSTGSITIVKIEYSTDSGGTWNTVVNSTYNDGIYTWSVPNNPSGNCLVRITDYYGSTSDTSDAVFSISPPIVIGVISPNGGENWEVGTVNNITWTSTGGTNVKIEYSTNNGATWSTITSSTPNTGSYAWTIPGTPSTSCLVKVSDTASSSSDTSDAVFTIFTNELIYCASSGTNQNYEWMAGVQVGSLNNPTGKSQYSDFTSMTVNVSKGGNVSVSLTPGFAYSSYTEYWRIWIDYNQDGDFADAGEAVFSGSGRSIVSGSFTVPTSATSGNTRMRVSMKYGGYPPYCGTFYYGEVEDYTVDIQ